MACLTRGQQADLAQLSCDDLSYKRNSVFKIAWLLLQESKGDFSSATLVAVSTTLIWYLLKMPIEVG